MMSTVIDEISKLKTENRVLKVYRDSNREQIKFLKSLITNLERINNEYRYIELQNDRKIVELMEGEDDV